MSILTKIVLAAIGFWLSSLLVIFVFAHRFPGFSGLVLMTSIPFALVLLIIALIALIVDKNKRWPALLFILIPLACYVALFHMMYLGALGNLYLNKGRYEATAKRMLAAQNDDEREQICGEECMASSTAPTRVWFHYVHGFLNWHDIVYDPSGELVKPMSSEERFKVSTGFRSAEHLTGNWYLTHESD